MKEKMKYWQTFSVVRTGERHEKKGMLCQDRVCFKQSSSCQVIALADGIGNCNLNVIGTERMLVSLCNFFLEEFDEIMDGSDEEVRYASLFEIKDTIGQVAEELDMPAETFASTILAVCINLEKNIYCSIHLGDGAILCKKSGRYQVLSYPENGMMGNQTFLTTSSNILQEIRVFRGDLDKMEGFALVSDGVYKNENDFRKLGTIIADASRRGMMPESGMDDQGIIGLVRTAGKG